MHTQLEKEKTEVARLKSVELVRLRKIEEQKKTITEQAMIANLGLERKKATLEYEARERKVREL